MNRPTLADLIVEVRKELEVAQKNAAKEKLKFKVDAIEIEAQVTVSTDANVTGGAKWSFFIFTEASVGAEAGVGREKVQTIRLKLTPERTTLVSDEDGPDSLPER